jgi:hypothetical protein
MRLNQNAKSLFADIKALQHAGGSTFLQLSSGPKAARCSTPRRPPSSLDEITRRVALLQTPNPDGSRLSVGQFDCRVKFGLTAETAIAYSTLTALTLDGDATGSIGCIDLLLKRLLATELAAVRTATTSMSDHNLDSPQVCPAPAINVCPI